MGGGIFVGFHDIGFYDKNDLSNQVVIFKDADLFNDKEQCRVSDAINDKMNSMGTQFGEKEYNLLCEVLAKHGVPKDKRKELKNLLGRNIRYGTLD